MSYFKKFTDACAGIAAFFASLFLIRKYMDFEPKVGEDVPSKLEQFLKPVGKSDFTMLIPLILLLIASVILGRLFKKYPFVCFAISLVPALYVSFMFEKHVLYGMLGIIPALCALHVVGNLADCATRDREDGGHRLSICAKMSSLMGVMLCYWVLQVTKLKAPESQKGLTLFDKDVLFKATPLDTEIITTLMWMLLILLGVSIILYNVYFVDAFISIVPAVYATHAMISGNLGIVSSVFFIMTVICATAHLFLLVFENNLSRREQETLKAKQ